MKRILYVLALLCALTVAGYAQNSGNGTITAASSDCTTAGSCVAVTFDQPSAVGAATLEVSGTWSATLQFEGKSATTWVALNAKPSNSASTASSATANGTWQVNVAGYAAVRVRCSAYTSGTANVIVRSSLAMASAGGGAPFTAGGTTANVLPKADGSSGLQDSSITDNGTLISTTEVIKVGDGTAAAPAFQFTNGGTALGFFRISPNVIAASAGGDTADIILSMGGIFKGVSSGGFGLSASTTDANNMDTILTRGAAATWQMGAANAAAPVAQTLTVQQPTATNTDQAGGTTTFNAQAGTGAGIPGPWVVKGGSTNTGTGATVQTLTARHIVGDAKALTTGAATTVLSIPLASLATTGGTLRYHIWATDGTSQCTSDNILVFNGENSAGVFVVTATKAMTSVTSCTATKTLTETWAITSANPALLQVTPTLTGITATTFRIVYSVDYFGDTAPTL